MKAMILAAGLGTRLKPWTLSHPKALVPVGGVPMLERVIEKLKSQGFDDIVINVHHFADQIIDFVRARDFGARIRISDESGKLLDTGGGLLHAAGLLSEDAAPFLVHNVDILSDADLVALMRAHERKGVDSTLLVSERDSSRRLIFDPDLRLRGWHNVQSGQLRPEGFHPESTDREFAFSGIQVMSPKVFADMERLQMREAFPVMDYLLHPDRRAVVAGHLASSLHLIDIGKPDSLQAAQMAITLE